MEQKFYRIKDVANFVSLCQSNKDISKYIGGRSFQIEEKTPGGNVKEIKIDDVVVHISEIGAYSVWFTRSEVCNFLEEVSPPNEEYFVIVRNGIGHISGVLVKHSLDEAKEAAASLLSDKVTVIIANTFLTAEKEVVFK